MFRKGKDRQGAQLQKLFDQGNQYLRQGQPAKAMEAFTQMQTLAKKAGFVQAEADAIFAQARTLERLSDQGRIGRELADKALDYYRASRINYQKLNKPDREALTLFHLADMLAHRGQFDEALTCFQSSLEINRQLGDRSAQARILYQIANIYAVQDDDPAAIENHEASLAIWRELGNAEEQARGLIFLGNLLAGEDLDRALEQYESCLRISREAGYVPGQVEAHYAIASIHQDRGDWQGMIEDAEQGIALAGEAGLIDLEIAGLGVKVFALEKLNRLSDAEQLLSAVMQRLSAINHPGLPKYAEWRDRVQREMSQG